MTAVTERTKKEIKFDSSKHRAFMKKRMTQVAKYNPTIGTDTFFMKSPTIKPASLRANNTRIIQSIISIASIPISTIGALHPNLSNTYARGMFRSIVTEIKI